MIELRLDLSRFERENAQTIAAVLNGAENGLDRAAQVALNQKRKKVQRTYTRPIPVSANGRPKWRRTGAWQSGQVARKSGALQREITTQGVAVRYESRLAELPVSRDGVNRRNEATADAARVIEPQIGPIIENAIENELKRIG